MKVKIKIKTLILLVFVFMLTIVWGIPAAILLIAGTVDHNKAPYFYEKYVSYPTSSNIRGNYKYARSLVDIQSKFTIYNNGWGGGGDTSPQDVEKAKIALQKVMEDSPKATEERDYLESYRLLLDLAIVTGDAQLLEEWTDFGQDSKDESILYYANIYKGFFLHINGDREAAMEILDKYENSDIKDVNYDILKAEILLFQGKYEEAKNLYKEIELNNSYSYGYGNFGSARYLGRDYWFEDTMDKFKGDNIISGRITHEGKPMPFVEIYLQEPDGGVMTYGNYYIAMTDKNGNFQTLGLKDGEYRLGIGIHDSRLTDRVLQATTSENIRLESSDGQFDFVFKDTLEIESPKHGEIVSGEEFTVSWEEVEGAGYYTIEIVNFLYPFAETGGLVRIPVLDDSGIIKYKTTSARVNMELPRGEIGGYGMNEEGVISPSAFLGLFVPSLEYPITVNAYDEKDNLITSSLGYRIYYDQIPSITLEGSFSEGEELIANQDYPEAIEYYENILKEDPDDIIALRYLTKLYGVGWKDGEENIDRAMELGQRYTDIVGNDRLLESIKRYIKY